MSTKRKKRSNSKKSSPSSYAAKNNTAVKNSSAKSAQNKSVQNKSVQNKNAQNRSAQPNTAQNKPNTIQNKTNTAQNKSNTIQNKSTVNKTTRKKPTPKTQNIPPYTIALACMGTIAIGVAVFSIFSKFSGTSEIMDSNYSSSETISSSSVVSSEEISSPSNSSKENISDESLSESVSELPDIEEDAEKKISEIALYGEELNAILTTRTGVNEKGENVGKASIPTKVLTQKLNVTPMSHKTSEDPNEKSDEETKEKDEKNEVAAKDNKESSSQEKIEKTAEKPSEKSAEKPSEKPAEKPSEKNNEKPNDNLNEKPTDKPAERQSEKSSDEPEDNSSENQSEESEVKTKYKGSGAANIPAWKKVNKDVRGWIRIPNTNINYPVVVGPNNKYYENKDIYKNSSRNGVIWADSDTKFGTGKQVSKNTVIYGHNWTNYSANPKIGRDSDVMFAQVAAFHHLDFAQKTPYIYYSTESEEMVWQVFAAFYTEVQFNYIVSDGSSDYMKNLISEAKSRSLHKYNVDVNENDKILTLSTCTRACGPSPNQRFVVMARKLRAGEKPFTPSITANPNHKRPNIR